jgi:hypothetical protein
MFLQNKKTLSKRKSSIDGGHISERSPDTNTQASNNLTSEGSAIKSEVPEPREPVGALATETNITPEPVNVKDYNEIKLDDLQKKLDDRTDFSPEAKAEELIIPENMTYLAKRAFGNNISNYGLRKLYCPESLASQCAAALSHLEGSDQSVEMISYQKTSDGKIFYNNKWYNSANGILLGDYDKKRIYTVDEATKISKKSGNTFKIRYK